MTLSPSSLRRQAEKVSPARRAAFLAQLPAEKAKRPRGMNKTEAAFAAHLRTLWIAGDVLWFGYSKVKLLLAERTTYTPDFAVITKDGAWEMLDCKGSKRMPDGRETFFAHEDSIVKIKLAAELLPFRLCVVFKTRDGWQRKEYRGLVDLLGGFPASAKTAGGRG